MAGVLYIGEVNLLADHLVDVLLDAAASGQVTIEARRVSAQPGRELRPRRNDEPEEGELRPQLLDRFGLAVDVAAPTDVEQRVAVVERRMAFDADPPGSSPDSPTRSGCWPSGSQRRATG